MVRKTSVKSVGGIKQSGGKDVWSLDLGLISFESEMKE